MPKEFSEVIGGAIGQGAEYAQKQLSLGLQMQNVQMEKDRNDTLKSEFEFKKATQIVGMLDKARRGGKLGQANLKDLSEFNKKLHFANEKWFAAIQDEDFQGPLNNFFNEYGKYAAYVGGVTDPAQVKNLQQIGIRAAEGLGQEPAVELVQKAAQQMAMINTALLKADASVAAAEKRGSARTDRLKYTSEAEVRRAWDSTMKAPKFMAESIGRLYTLLDAVDEGKLVDTKQFVSKLANEQTILETGGRGQTSEGSRERSLVDTYAVRYRDLIQKVKDEPQSALSPDFLQQIRAETDELRDSWTTIIDANANTVAAGTDENQQRVVKARYDQFRKSFEPMLKGWSGPGLDIGGTIDAPGKKEIASKEKAAAAEAPKVEPKKPEAPKAPEKKSAPLTPANLQKAMRLKGIIDGIKDPKEKAAAIKKALDKLSPELAKKVGIQ